MEKTLDLCGLPADRAKEACQALQRDSQKGTLCAGRGSKLWKLSESEIKLCH